jgi:hypothetical protein
MTKSLGLLLAGLAAGLLAGWYLAPGKVEVRTVTVESKQTDKVIKRIKVTTPDGTTKTETTVTDKSVVDKNTQHSETPSQPDWLVSVMVHSEGSYGAQVQRRILGPIWVGAGGNTRGTAFITLGLSF